MLASSHDLDAILFIVNLVVKYKCQRCREYQNSIFKLKIPSWMIAYVEGKGYFAECGLWNAESWQGVICGKFDADFFCGMKGKVRNESMRNVAKMNIY